MGSHEQYGEYKYKCLAAATWGEVGTLRDDLTQHSSRSMLHACYLCPLEDRKVPQRNFWESKQISLLKFIARCNDGLKAALALDALYMENESTQASTCYSIKIYYEALRDYPNLTNEEAISILGGPPLGEAVPRLQSLSDGHQRRGFNIDDCSPSNKTRLVHDFLRIRLHYPTDDKATAYLISQGINIPLDTWMQWLIDYDRWRVREMLQGRS